MLFAIASIAMNAISQDSSSTIYELRSYVSEPGRQADVLKLIEGGGMAFMKKHQLNLVAAWVPSDSKDERVFTLISHQNKASCDASWTAFQNDPAWKEVVQKSAVDGKKPVKSIERVFMSVNDYSPSLNMKPAGERVFELRTYIASKGNLAGLNARFRNHTLKLFEKYGMTNIMYWSALEGEPLTCGKLLEAVSPIGKADAKIDVNAPAAGNSLIYFIAHASEEAAKDSFGKFRVDPVWEKVRSESEANAGGMSLTADGGVKSLFLKATSFSPLK